VKNMLSLLFVCGCYVMLCGVCLHIFQWYSNKLKQSNVFYLCNLWDLNSTLTSGSMI